MSTFLVYCFQASQLGFWMIDDAGISFAYSRNFALGHGLVSQPGMAPVEGFSNLLWVLLISPVFVLDLPYVVAVKLLSAFFVLGAGYLSVLALQRYAQVKSIWIFLILILLFSNPAFVIWTISGLENALYVFLIVVLFYRILSVDFSTSSLPSSASIALLVFLVGITRPDGILFLFAFPSFLLLVNRSLPSSGLVSKEVLGRHLVLYLVVVSLLFLGLCIFRFCYFGDLLPNTYYAKQGSIIVQLKELIFLDQKKLILFLEFAGHLGWFGALLFFMFIPYALRLIILGKETCFELLASLFFLLSFLIFLLLPRDWMGELRFATPVFVFLYMGLVLFIKRLSELASYRSVKILVVVFVFLYVAESIQIHGHRMEKFASNRIVPLERISRKAEKFNRLKEEYHLDGASILAPDLGGLLMGSNLRVYDLAGLCDKKIARTLYVDKKGLWDYIFNEIKPSFIEKHTPWTYFSMLESDERFYRDYVLLDNFEGMERGRIYNGAFVRREIVEKMRLNDSGRKSVK